MKIRTGFVSNSSSASYIVEIRGIEYEDFIDTIFRQYDWTFFDKSKIKKNLQQRLNNGKEYLEDAIENKKNWWFKSLEKSITEDMELLEKIDSLSSKEIVKTILERSDLSVIADDDDIEIKGGTSMHNDFDTGLPSLLKEIVLYFIFDTDHKVKCRRIDYS